MARKTSIHRSIRESKLYRADISCVRKRFFKTEAEALAAADVGMLENMTLTLGVYRCSTCLQWHLTSLSKNEK